MRNPVVANAKKLAQYYGATAVVIVALDENGGAVAGASYATTKASCKEIGCWLDSWVEDLEQYGLKGLGEKKQGIL